MVLTKIKNFLLNYKLSFIGAFIAGLCCFSPIVIFLIGISTATFAGSLADELYYNYRWYFRISGVIFLLAAYIYQYKIKSKSCSTEEKVVLRKKIINAFLISFFVFVISYILWLYVIVDWFGEILGIW
jgi:hypothetical protein